MNTTNSTSQHSRPTITATAGACLLAAALLSGISSEATANDFNYTEVGMSLTPDAIDGADPTLAFSGSYEIIENISIIGSYSNTRLAEYRGVEIDFSFLQLGVAYHTPLQAKTDLTADIRYVGTDLSISDDSRSASLGTGSGYRLGGGVRHQYSDRIELNSALSYMSVESESDFALSVGGRYFFNQNFSAGAAYTTGDFDGISGSIHYNF